MFPHKNQSILMDLDPEFASKISAVLANCKQQGIEIELREGKRNTFTQAVYWRRSRSKEEVDHKIKELQNSNADFLAYSLFVVGEQHGPHATNALPGLSWHQYGLAVDCAWILDGQICWDNENLYQGINGYEVLAQEAKRLHIYSGHDWTNLRDSGHLQANEHASPLAIYNLEEIDELMKEYYLPLLTNRSST